MFWFFFVRHQWPLRQPARQKGAYKSIVSFWWRLEDKMLAIPRHFNCKQKDSKVSQQSAIIHDYPPRKTPYAPLSVYSTQVLTSFVHNFLSATNLFILLTHAPPLLNEEFKAQWSVSFSFTFDIIFRLASSLSWTDSIYSNIYQLLHLFFRWQCNVAVTLTTLSTNSFYPVL